MKYKKLVNKNNNTYNPLIILTFSFYIVSTLSILSLLKQYIQFLYTDDFFGCFLRDIYTTLYKLFEFFDKQFLYRRSSNILKTKISHPPFSYILFYLNLNISNSQVFPNNFNHLFIK